jgi:hypothetical protein
VPFAKNNYNGQVKEDEIRRACSMNGKRRKYIGGKTRKTEA